MLTQFTQSDQFYRLTLDSLRADYRRGLYTALGAVTRYLQITLAPGWKRFFRPIDIYTFLGMSRSTFYRVLSSLQAGDSFRINLDDSYISISRTGSRAYPEPEHQAIALQPEPAPEPEHQAIALQPEPEPEPEHQAIALQPEPALEPEHQAIALQPEPALEPEHQAIALQPEPAPEPEHQAIALQPEPEPGAIAPLDVDLYVDWFSQNVLPGLPNPPKNLRRVALSRNMRLVHSEAFYNWKDCRQKSIEQLQSSQQLNADHSSLFSQILPVLDERLPGREFSCSVVNISGEVMLSIAGVNYNLDRAYRSPEDAAAYIISCLTSRPPSSLSSLIQQLAEKRDLKYQQRKDWLRGVFLNDD